MSASARLVLRFRVVLLSLVMGLLGGLPPGASVPAYAERHSAADVAGDVVKFSADGQENILAAALVLLLDFTYG